MYNCDESYAHARCKNYVRDKLKQFPRKFIVSWNGCIIKCCNERNLTVRFFIFQGDQHREKRPRRSMIMRSLERLSGSDQEMYIDLDDASVDSLTGKRGRHDVAGEVKKKINKLRKIKKKDANPLRLSIVLSHYMYRNWIGKSEAGRH